MNIYSQVNIPVGLALLFVVIVAIGLAYSYYKQLRPVTQDEFVYPEPTSDRLYEAYQIFELVENIESTKENRNPWLLWLCQTNRAKIQAKLLDMRDEYQQ